MGRRVPGRNLNWDCNCPLHSDLQRIEPGSEIRRGSLPGEAKGASRTPLCENTLVTAWRRGLSTAAKRAKPLK